MTTSIEIDSMNGLYDNINKFYRDVVSGGRCDIHIGYYRTPTDSPLVSAENAVDNLIDLGLSVGAKLSPGKQVIDLGSGMGGSSHLLAERYGVHVTSLNILESQNEINRLTVKEKGLGDLIDVVTGSYDNLPADWTNKFDTIWCMDAFLHAPDKPLAIAEAFRVAKPGAVLIFSDVMMGPLSRIEDIEVYRTRNNIKSEIYTAGKYEEEFVNAGFEVLRVIDKTGNIAPWVRRMHAELKARIDELAESSRPYLEKLIKSYDRSARELTEREGQAWTSIICWKPKEGEEGVHRNVYGGNKPQW